MPRSAHRSDGKLLQLVRGLAGWRSIGADSSRRLIAALGGLLFSILCVGILAVCFILFPQYAILIWWAQLLWLLISLGFVITTLAYAKKNFFEPLNHVRHWASEIRQGDFTARVPVARDGGFDGLADDINRLAEWLESLANDAESQLKQQAERLSAKSQSLQLLYDVAALANLGPGNEQLISQYLNSLCTILDAEMGRAYVQTNTGLKLVATFGEWGLATADDKPDAELADKSSPVVPSAVKPSGNQQKIELPLEYRDKVLGMYELYFDMDNQFVHSEVFDLLPNIGRHLGMALEKTRLEQESLRLSTVEERTRVANELHDSLAQSLAALKLQVRVLDETLAQGEEPAIWQQMERVENGLEETILELRDLIAQFRGSAQDGKVENAIEQVITQFKRRSDIKVFFHNHWDYTVIAPEVQIQIARIIQEALTNTQKHSGATSVRVLLRCETDGLHEAIVEDDGAGFDQLTKSSHPGQQIGLTIMRERAQRIGGSLTIDSEAGDGTRVTLAIRFPAASAAVTAASSVA